MSPPFYGAITKKNKIEIRIFRASIFYTDIEKHQFINSLFGEVVEKFPNGKILVRCSGGVILLHEFDGLEVIRVIFLTKLLLLLKNLREISMDILITDVFIRS